MSNTGTNHDDQYVGHQINIDSQIHNYNLNCDFAEHSQKCKASNNNGIYGGHTLDNKKKQSAINTDIESNLRNQNTTATKHGRVNLNPPTPNTNVLNCCNNGLDTISTRLELNPLNFKELSTLDLVFYEPNCPANKQQFNNNLGANTTLAAKDNYKEKVQCHHNDKSKPDPNNIKYAYMNCGQNCQDRSYPCNEQNNNNITGTNIITNNFTTS